MPQVACQLQVLPLLVSLSTVGASPIEVEGDRVDAGGIDPVIDGSPGERMSVFELLTVSSGVMTPAQVGDVIALCSEVFETDYSFYMNLDLVARPRFGLRGRVFGRPCAVAQPGRCRVGDGPCRCLHMLRGWRRTLTIRAVAMARRSCGVCSTRSGTSIPRRAFPGRRGSGTKTGWERCSGRLFIVKDGAVTETLDECVMLYRTPRTEALDLRASLTRALAAV